MFLLDTNICIAALKGDREVMRKLMQYAGRIHVGMLVIAELQFGIEKLALSADHETIRRKRVLLQRFIDTTDGIVSFGLELIPTYARLRAELESKGVPVGAHDLWIAAQAIHEDAVLVSANTREFARIPGLRLENWVA